MTARKPVAAVRGQNQIHNDKGGKTSSKPLCRLAARRPKAVCRQTLRDLRANGSLYLLMLPVIVFYLFSDIPMGGADRL
jgi:hypothetical protein